METGFYSLNTLSLGKTGTMDLCCNISLFYPLHKRMIQNQDKGNPPRKEGLL